MSKGHMCVCFVNLLILCALVVAHADQINPNDRAELEMLRAENAELRAENTKLRLKDEQKGQSSNTRADDVMSLLADAARAQEMDTDKAHDSAGMTQGLIDTMVYNTRQVLIAGNGAWWSQGTGTPTAPKGGDPVAGVDCFKDNNLAFSAVVPGCGTCPNEGRCNDDCQIRPDVIDGQCKPNSAWLGRVQTRYVVSTPEWEASGTTPYTGTWTFHSGSPAGYPTKFENAPQGCASNIATVADCKARCNTAECNAVYYGNYDGGRCCAKKILVPPSGQSYTYNTNHPSGSTTYGFYMKEGVVIPKWTFGDAHPSRKRVFGTVRCPCEENGAALTDKEALHRIIGQVAQIGTPRYFAATVAGGLSKGEGWSANVAYGTIQMIDCWKRKCGVQETTDLLGMTTGARTSCRDPGEITDCHPCAEAIEAYCAVSHPNVDPSVCFVDQLCSHADTCKTGECASYGEQTQLLQNNSTAQKADGQLELLEETVKTSVGWDCG